MVRHEGPFSFEMVSFKSCEGSGGFFLPSLACAGSVIFVFSGGFRSWLGGAAEGFADAEGVGVEEAFAEVGVVLDVGEAALGGGGVEEVGGGGNVVGVVEEEVDAEDVAVEGGAVEAVDLEAVEGGLEGVVALRVFAFGVDGVELADEVGFFGGVGGGGELLDFDVGEGRAVGVAKGGEEAVHDLDLFGAGEGLGGTGEGDLGQRDGLDEIGTAGDLAGGIGLERGGDGAGCGFACRLSLRGQRQRKSECGERDGEAVLHTGRVPQLQHGLAAPGQSPAIAQAWLREL